MKGDQKFEVKNEMSCKRGEKPMALNSFIGFH